jgi:hypothetical protein
MTRKVPEFIRLLFLHELSLYINRVSIGVSVYRSTNLITFHTMHGESHIRRDLFWRMGKNCVLLYQQCHLPVIASLWALC